MGYQRRTISASKKTFEAIHEDAVNMKMNFSVFILYLYDRWLISKGLTWDERSQVLNAPERRKSKKPQVLKMLEEGADHNQIRAATGLTRQYINSISREAGYTSLSRHKELQVLADIMQSPMRLSDIGDKHGLSMRQIHSLAARARRAGLDFQYRKPGKKGKHEKSKAA